ncbi:helix-turn-helix transcriptional regulator [Rubritalea profundi]|uniref:Uncharacterized protein n=1 Tax=Rubritalea profundi TaxID=1658618 RepID=A0A2S7U4J6_9BACT|nr:WYL domain-containing protein [Rubritalea profundi]PQJ29500.1 hypothetical protein BSZ32_14030 [Rubritalea profundi]
MSAFGGGRTATVRMMNIFDSVKNGSFPNCRKLAEEFEVRPKTIQRDITYMRDQMGIELHYNQQLHGYELVGELEDFPLIDLQVEDLAALFLARSAMGGIQGTKLAESLQPAFERLSQQLEGKVSLRWNDLDEAFAIKKNAVVEADLTLFGKLAEAVLKQNEVSFKYRGIKALVSTHRRIQPYHVGEISGGWYVIGYDLDRDGLRTFALQRMTGVKVLKTWFERPDDFSIGEHLGGGIGVWSGKADGAESIEVVIELTGWAARLVQERLWHPSQKITILDDLGEKIQMTMGLDNLTEVTQVVLSWGSNAKVLAPEALVQSVCKELEGVQKLYE